MRAQSALVLALRKTVFRQSPVRPDDPVSSDPLFRLGAQVDRAKVRAGKEKPDERRYAGLFYRAGRTLRKTTRRIRGSLSFALALLVLALCGIFLYLLRH